MSDKSKPFEFGLLEGEIEKIDDGKNHVVIVFEDISAAIAAAFTIAIIGFAIGAILASIFAPPKKIFHIDCAPSLADKPTELA